MKRDSDCSSTSSWRNPSSCETASLACRILPSRSETKTGSGAFAMIMSASREPCHLAPRSALLTVPDGVPKAGDLAISDPPLHGHRHRRVRGATIDRVAERVKDARGPDILTCSEAPLTLL